MMLENINSVYTAHRRDTAYQHFAFDSVAPETSFMREPINDASKYASIRAVQDFCMRHFTEHSPTYYFAPDLPSSSYNEQVSTGISCAKETWVFYTCQNLVLAHYETKADLGLDWLQIAYNGAAELQLSEIASIVDQLTSILNERRYSEVDLEMCRADLGRMSPDAIAAIVHITFPAKENIPSWKAFVERANISLKGRYEEENFFEGLI